MNVPKIAELLGKIDPDLIDEADAPVIKRSSTKKRYLIAACFLALVILGSAALIYDARPDISLKIPEETLTASDDMPPPFEEETEPLVHRSFYSPCIPQFDLIPKALAVKIPKDNFSVWLDSYEGGGAAVPDSIESYPNLYTFVTDFGIRRDELTSVITSEEESLPSGLVDLIYSGDVDGITAAVATDYSIVIGVKVYSPYWVYSHDPDDYAEAGITLSDIDEKKAYYYNDFGLSAEAVTALEEKIGSEFMHYGDSLVYRDGTVIYNLERPLVQKEFAVVEIERETADSVFYLVSNDPGDDSEEIYTVRYELGEVTLGCDSLDSFKIMEAAVGDGGGLYPDGAPDVAGTVVRVAWDGYALDGGEFDCLENVSRIQFSDAESNLYASDLKELEVKLQYVSVKDSEEGERRLLENLKPYSMNLDTWAESEEEYFAKLKNVATVMDTDGVIYADGKKYVCTGYILTGDEFLKYMYYCDRELRDAPAVSVPMGGAEPAEYGDIYKTRWFFLGDFDLYGSGYDPALTGCQASCLESGTALYFADDFCFARLGRNTEMLDGRTFYGWLFRLADDGGEEKTAKLSAVSKTAYPDGLEFLGELTDPDPEDIIALGSETFGRTEYLLTSAQFELFKKTGEYVGKTGEGIGSGSFPPGCEVYRVRDVLLAVCGEPEISGWTVYNNVGSDPVPIMTYGRLFKLIN